MRVIAKSAGFYQDHRVRAGEEFDFDLARHGNVPFKKEKDGTLVLDPKTRNPIRDPEGQRELPAWVVPASAESRTKLADGKKAEAEKAKAAALASAGPKRKGGGLATAQPEAGNGTAPSDLV